MLQRVSWEDFSIFILLVAGGYYLYVVVRYYPDEVFGFFTRRKKRPAGGEGNVQVAKVKDMKRDADERSATEQPELLVKVLTIIKVQASPGNGNSRFRKGKKYRIVIYVIGKILYIFPVGQIKCQ